MTLDTELKQMAKSDRAAVAMNYKYHTYELVNQRLDLIASRLSGALQRAGYKALPIAASQKVDQERLLGAFSHKMAAHLDGLGIPRPSCASPKNNLTKGFQ